MALEMVLHEFEIVRVILFSMEFEIGIDVQGIPGNAFEKVDAVICGNDMIEACRQIFQMRSWLIPVFHSMNMLVNAEQQIGPHIAV